jgi:hypothetical protein
MYFSVMSKIFAFLYFSFMSYIACVSLIIIWEAETCRFIKHLKTWLCRKFPYVNKHLLLRSVGRNVQMNDAELISRHYFTQYYQHRRRKLIKLVPRLRFNVGIFIINSYTITKIGADYWLLFLLWVSLLLAYEIRNNVLFLLRWVMLMSQRVLWRMNVTYYTV